MMEYEIRQIADLMKVPADRRPAMLADLTEWMALHDHLRETLGNLATYGHITLPSVFRWNDDGIVGLREVTITIVPEATP